MGDAFSAFDRELRYRAIDERTKDRYCEIVGRYRRWLDDLEHDTDATKEYIAHLRDRGYAQRSLLLYYHVLKQLVAADGGTLRLKMLRPHVLPQYYSRADIERLIAQAERGLYR